MFTSVDGPPENAPSFGVLCIAQSKDTEDPHAARFEIQNSWDWYFWEPNRQEWWGCDLQGLLDRLLHNLPISAVKQARSAPNLTFRRTMQRAKEEAEKWLT